VAALPRTQAASDQPHRVRSAWTGESQYKARRIPVIAHNRHRLRQVTLFVWKNNIRFTLLAPINQLINQSINQSLFANAISQANKTKAARTGKINDWHSASSYYEIWDYRLVKLFCSAHLMTLTTTHHARTRSRTNERSQSVTCRTETVCLNQSAPPLIHDRWSRT